jgi:hypothetical protein
MLTSSHSKARAAVSRLLINPASAQFDVLRSVEADAAKYVCGNVKAKDKSGSYSGYRAFVYTVAIDFARIDDDGQIAQRRVAFSDCPIPEEEQIAQQKMAISPGVLSMLKPFKKTSRQVIPRRCQRWRRKFRRELKPLPVRLWRNSWVNWPASPLREGSRQIQEAGLHRTTRLTGAAIGHPPHGQCFPLTIRWGGRPRSEPRLKPWPLRKMSRTVGRNRSPETRRSARHLKRSRKRAVRCLRSILKARNSRRLGPPSCGCEKSTATPANRRLRTNHASGIFVVAPRLDSVLPQSFF